MCILDSLNLGGKRTGECIALFAHDLMADTSSRWIKVDLMLLGEVLDGIIFL